MNRNACKISGAVKCTSTLKNPITIFWLLFHFSWRSSLRWTFGCITCTGRTSILSDLMTPYVVLQRAIKRNQTEIVKQQIPDALEEDKEWVLKVVPNHSIYNVALNMRQLWLKYLIQHSFAESNYELKSLLWFHLQLSTLCTQVYEKEVLDSAQKTASEECWI